MKYKTAISIMFGIVMAMIWTAAMSNVSDPAEPGIGVCIGVAFACLGRLLGRIIDRKGEEKE